MSYLKQLTVFNVATFIFAFTLSMLSQTSVLGWYQMADIAAKYASGITPAPFTFSIWSVIYLTLFIMVCYHVIQAFRKRDDYITNQEVLLMGRLFAANQLAISLWIYTWLNDMPGISLLLIFVQLYTLYLIDRRLHLLNPRKGHISLFITQMPLSLYFGWITVATLANFAAWLSSLGWLAHLQVDLYVSYALLFVAIAIGAVTVYFKHNIFYGLAVLWAIYGIIMRHFDAGDEAFQSLIYLGVFGMVIILLTIIKTAMVYTLVKEKPFRPKKKHHAV